MNEYDMISFSKAWILTKKEWVPFETITMVTAWECLLIPSEFCIVFNSSCTFSISSWLIVIYYKMSIFYDRFTWFRLYQSLWCPIDVLNKVAEVDISHKLVLYGHFVPSRPKWTVCISPPIRTFCLMSSFVGILHEAVQ